MKRIAWAGALVVLAVCLLMSPAAFAQQGFEPPPPPQSTLTPEATTIGGGAIGLALVGLWMRSKRRRI